MGSSRWLREKIKWLGLGINWLWREIIRPIISSGTAWTLLSIGLAVYLSIATNEAAIRSPEDMWNLPCKRIFSKNEYFNKDKYANDKSDEWASTFWGGVAGLSCSLVSFKDESFDKGPKQLSDITEEKNGESSKSKELDITHVFVLDVSKSIPGKVDVPPWYKEANNYLVREFGINEKSAPNRKIDGFDLAKTYLNSLLASFITPGSKRQIGNMAFAVWGLGDAKNTVDPLFPEKNNSVTAEYDDIKKAIHAINGLSANDRNTEFSETLGAIIDRYAPKRVEPDKKSPPSFVITIISNFFDDPKNKDFKEDRLKKVVEELAVRNIVLNAVVLAKGDVRTRTYFPVVDNMEKAFRTEAFGKVNLLSGSSEVNVLDEHYGRTLYPFKWIATPLYLYYEEAKSIEFTNDIRIGIDLQKEGQFKQKDSTIFGVRLPMIHKSGNQEVRLLGRVRKNNGEYSREKGSMRWLTSNSYFSRKLEEGNILEISPYRLSSNNYLLLELSDQSRLKKFLFNVYPKKILSEFVAWLLVGLLSVVIFFFPVLILIRLIFLIGRFLIGRASRYLSQKLNHFMPELFSSTSPRHLNGQWLSFNPYIEWKFDGGDLHIKEPSGEKITVPYESNPGKAFITKKAACQDIANKISALRDLGVSYETGLRFEFLNNDHILATWQRVGTDQFRTVLIEQTRFHRS
uniref:VWFA domain-containing protein n=1 Tax=Candidatus Kentrum sp. LPFa TaxID=2126335 RepID=A0A450W8D1_9GAMM|nr:MAG: hypothetical protein BECKLPF1236A_GA0070988_100866 [Candidatus Kentron sp. LPFa]VFK31278.1 MAG: hypothetical protein BECKLPF1236C_GA0070990_101336 [Candidatus Kentron sp. LPFa]